MPVLSYFHERNVYFSIYLLLYMMYLCLCVGVCPCYSTQVEVKEQPQVLVFTSRLFFSSGSSSIFRFMYMSGLLACV